MKTLLLQEPGKLVATTTQPPGDPGPGEALVRVHRVGVCGTDIHAFHGRQPFFTYPRILGHELGVEVLATGPDVTHVRPGDRCAVEPYLHCGTCIACRRGRPNCCVNLRVLGVHTDGGQRERLLLPAAKLHPASDLDFDQLALVETLGIGAHAAARAALEPGEFVAVIGTGPIGLAIVPFALAAGTRVVVLDTDPQRLDFCARHFAIEGTLHVEGAVDTGQLAQLGGGDLPTAVFDATGNAASMRGAFKLPAHGGRLVFVGLFPGEVTFDDPDFHRRELTLLASRNSTAADFQHILRLIRSGQVDTRPWITHRAPAHEVPDFFPQWATPGSGVLKAMIEF